MSQESDIDPGSQDFLDEKTVGSKQPARSRPGIVGARRRRRHSFAELKERADRTRGDEVNYFKVDAKCLGCGARARVKVDKLHGKLRCSSCGTIMHMSRNGTWKLGPPPSLLEEGQQTETPGEYTPPTRLEKLIERYPALKHPTTHKSAAALCGVLLIFWGVRTYFGGSADLPQSLIGRAGVICESLLTEDMGTFEKLTTHASTHDAHKWFTAVRARIERAEAAGDKTPQFVIRVLYERDTDGTGCVVANFNAPPGRTDLAPGRRRKLFTCALYFLSTDGQDWRLDGKRTLQEM